jgi:hypothetical protein
MSGFPRYDGEFSRFDEPRLEKRGRVIRMAIVYTALAVACGVLVAIALYGLFTGDGGLVVMLVVFGFIGFLTGYHARNFLRDLRKKPIQVEGDVLRKWSKANRAIFFFPSYYIMVEKNIYSVSREEYAMLLEDDLVRVTCYPHSLTVERLERYDSSEKQFVPATAGMIER